MKALDVRIILSQEILKIEPTNFGPFWTENRLLSQCVFSLHYSLGTGLVLLTIFGVLELLMIMSWSCQRFFPMPKYVNYKIIMLKYKHDHAKIC